MLLLRVEEDNNYLLLQYAITLMHDVLCFYGASSYSIEM